MKNMSELARAIGRTPQLVSAYAKGVARPSLDTAELLAAAVPGTSPLDWMQRPAEMVALALGQDSPAQPEAA